MESVCRGNSTAGSNPALSAIIKRLLATDELQSSTTIQTLERTRKNRHGIRERRGCRGSHSNDHAGTVQGPTLCVGHAVPSERWKAGSKRQCDKQAAPMFSNAHWEQHGGQRPTLRFIGPAVRVLSRYPRQAFPFLRQRLSHCLNRSERSWNFTF